MERNDSLKSVDPRRGFKPEAYQTPAQRHTILEAQLAEAREMLAHYVKELRQVKAQRDALLAACQALVTDAALGCFDHVSQAQAAIALTQKEEV